MAIEREDREVQLKELRAKEDQFEQREIEFQTEIQNFETKIQLMKEALANSNQELKIAEHNNRDLMNILDSYDQKLDELNEQNEFKDL